MKRQVSDRVRWLNQLIPALLVNALILLGSWALWGWTGLGIAAFVLAALQLVL